MLMIKILHAIYKTLEVLGTAFYTITMYVLIIVMLCAALFGGTIQIKINNPFWDNKEATE